MKNKIYIHIGLGKAATTWFQEKLFSKCKQINYLGKTENYYPEWLIQIHYADDYWFNKNLKDLKKSINKIINFNNNKPLLLSSEAFTNKDRVFSQGYRTKKLFSNFDVKIILFLRNPIDILKSGYKYDAMMGIFWKNLEEYLDFKEFPFVLEKRLPIYLKGLWYDEIIDYYSELFGKNNLCILKYEEFKTKPQKFVDKLGKFMQVDFGNIENIANQKVLKSPEEKELKFLRIRNFKDKVLKYLPNSKIKIDEKDFDNEVISEELGNKLKKYFHDKCSMYKENLNLNK